MSNCVGHIRARTLKTSHALRSHEEGTDGHEMKWASRMICAPSLCGFACRDVKCAL